MLSVRTLLLSAVSAVVFATAAMAQVTISDPPPDRVVIADKVTIRGTHPKGSPPVLTVNGKQVPVAVTADTWAATNVALTTGLNTIVAAAGAAKQTLTLTRASNISAHKTGQVIRIDWEPGTDDELRKIAAGTLDATLDDAALTLFANRVKNRFGELLFARYATTGDITVVSATAASDVHVVSMRALDANGLFGESPLDCGNTKLAQTSKVYVGTYRAEMVDHLDDWLPMRKTDTVDVRVEDVAHALARTAAHEVGHSLGLVAEKGNCSWMNGCGGAHSCAVFQKSNVGVNRFNFGHFIMDPGPDTSNHARIAEAVKDRSPQRMPAEFCDFDRTYLEIIHPRAAEEARR